MEETFSTFDPKQKQKTKSKSKYHQGKFFPKNAKKYRGDPTNIVYRSSWELKMMHYLDNNVNVLEWSSESIVIPYFDPTTNKVRRYFPDFMAKVRDRGGKVLTLILEVKPSSQTVPPQARRMTKKFLSEALTYAVNEAKWNAASKYCQDRGFEFRVITEYDLGIK